MSSTSTEVLPMDSNGGDDDHIGDTPRRKDESRASHEAAPRDTNNVPAAQETAETTSYRLQGYPQQARSASQDDTHHRTGPGRDRAPSAPRRQDWSQIPHRRLLNTPPYLNLAPNTEAVSNPRSSITPGFELPRDLYVEPYRPRTGPVPRFNHPPIARFTETTSGLNFSFGTQNGSSALLNRALQISRIIYIDLRTIIDTDESEIDSIHPACELVSTIANWPNFGSRARSLTPNSVSQDTIRAIEEFPVSSYPAFPEPRDTRRGQPSCTPTGPPSVTPHIAPLRPAHISDNAHRPNNPAGYLATDESRTNRPVQAFAVHGQHAGRSHLVTRHTGHRLDRNTGNKNLSPVKEEASYLKGTRAERSNEDHQSDEDEVEAEPQVTLKYRHNDKDRDGPSDQPPTGRAAGGNVSSASAVTPNFERTQDTFTSTSSCTVSSKEGPTDSAVASVNCVVEVIIFIDVDSASFHLLLHIESRTDMASTIPRPGPAKLTANAGLDEWLEEAKQCHYLPERAMKELCEMVKEVLMEESNIQPVCTPVTVCGDIHGQFYDLLELFRVAGGMPGETHVQAPKTSTSIITSEDIEPPTEITDPKLKKRLRNRGSQEASPGDADDDEVETEASPARPDSAVEVSTSSQSAETRFIFLGDFVDRGYFSLETFTLLMCLKAKYPDRIVLVRGNHESRQITQVYGFYEECQQKYGNASVWKACCHVFDFLVLAAIVDGELLCVHGGLSPEIRTIDQIRVVARAQEIPHEGAFCDLVWSDPEDVETWAISPRGAGWLFGDKVATEFNHVNGLKLIARAHQLVNEGYKYHFPQNSVVTVWSAPNYCYRCGNVASIMTVDKEMNPKFSIFSAVPDDQRHVPANRRGPGDYFL